MVASSQALPVFNIISLADMANADDLGWRFLLAPLRGNRLLWLGSPAGEEVDHLARMVADVTVLRQKTVESACARHPIADHVAFVEIEGTAHHLPLADESFDAVIIADANWIGNRSEKGKNAAASRAFVLLSELHRVLRNDGYLFVKLSNRYHFANLFSMLHPAAALEHRRVSDCPSVAWIESALLDSGFDRARTYRMLSTDGVIEEVLVGGRYRSVKNAFAFKQKLKAILLSSPLAGFFAASLGVLAAKGRQRQTFLDGLIGKMQEELAAMTEGGGRLSVRRYLVLPGKVILSVCDSIRPQAGRIVVLPLVDAVRDRLRDEAKTLKALHATETSIRSVVPICFGEHEFEGQTYFVQQEMPGTSVDLPTSSLAVMTARAAAQLTEFHVQTAVDVLIDSQVLDELFLAPLGRIAEALGPASSSETRRIGELAGSMLRGRPFRLVWMHGDFKIENLLFDPDNLGVTGIIDWDLSERAGFPLGDMLYLLAYNRVIRNGGEVEDVILDGLIPRRLSGEEASLLDGYMSELGLSNDLFGILVVMFCIHHLAYRRDARRCSKETVVKMRSVLAAAGQMMACKCDPGSLQ